jgi:hypothetical protein
MSQEIVEIARRSFDAWNEGKSRPSGSAGTSSASSKPMTSW